MPRKPREELGWWLIQTPDGVTVDRATNERVAFRRAADLVHYEYKNRSLVIVKPDDSEYARLHGSGSTHARGRRKLLESQRG